MDDFYVLKRDAMTMENLKVKVDLIYLDPPFNLSRRFHIEEETGFDDYWENDDAYITWYAEIITKCYNMLNPNGTIYCHNNFINNALVLSKVSANVRNAFDTNISWKRSHPHNNIKNGWGNITDSIMVLKKGAPYFAIEYGELNETYKNNSFTNVDERGNYALSPVTGEKSRIGHMYTYNGYTPKYGWRKPLEDVKVLDKNGLIHFGKNKPYLKKYLAESKGVPVQNFWYDIHPITRSEQNKRHYPTQKPIKLLERIVRASCPPGGVVFDPFAGAGTTMRAVRELGEKRKCITSDLNDDALKIIKRDMKQYFVFPNEDGQDIWKNI